MKHAISLAALIAIASLQSAQAAPAVQPASVPAATSRDGSRDFAFLIGAWRTRYRLLAKRLHNSHTWYECDGTSSVRPFWGGSGNLEDGDLKCPARYIHGMTLRMYDAASHQWSLYWGTTKIGLAMPPQVGHFDANGIGDFLAMDTWEGKPVIVRYRWSQPSADHPHFEQSYSADGGNTWEVNWTTDYTRISR